MNNMRRTIVSIGWWVAVLSLAACAAQNRPLQLVAGSGPIFPAGVDVEGWVEVRYDVTASGEVTNITVIDAQPQGVFDAAAIAAVRTWRFNAPLVEGVPQPAPGRVSRLDFRVGSTQYDDY